MKVFENRLQAGQELAEALEEYAGRGDVVVLGLPRGGVPVAMEVARKLRAPLDVFLVRKLGVPGHEELAMGAIASGGVLVRNEDIIASLNISEADIERVAQDETEELKRRERAYRGDRAPVQLAGKTVILVDDGLATGASMRAAVEAVRHHDPAQVVVAVPTAPPDTKEALKTDADDVVCVETPRPFGGVGRWYRDFAQTNDEEVRELLEEAYAKLPAG
jgi:putative phosphoribosyl transferase